MVTLITKLFDVKYDMIPQIIELKTNNIPREQPLGQKQSEKLLSLLVIPLSCCSKYVMSTGYTRRSQ